MESAFIVGSLIAVLECVLPAIEHKNMDWDQLVFACAFGLLIVLAHAVAAYVRPPERDGMEERIEQALYTLEERMQQQGPGPPSTRFAQLRQWAQNDPTWAPTTPDLPAVHPPAMPPPTQRTQKRPGM
jgi:hypothetical protein